MDPIYWFIILGILFVMLAVFSPYIGLIIYIGFIYLRPSDIFPILIPFHVTRVMAIAVIIGFILYMAMRQKRFTDAIHIKLLLGFLFVIIISFTFGWKQVCMERLEQMLKNFIGFFLIINLIYSRAKLRFFVWALMIYSSILAWDTIQQYFMIGAGRALEVRLGGFTGGYFGGAGDFAVMMNIMVPFAFFSMISEKNPIFKVMSLLLVGLFTYAMMVTFARGGGVIAFGIAIITILILSVKGRGIIAKFLSIIMIAGLVAGLVAVAPSQFKDRSASIMHYQQEGTGMRRIEYWKYGIKMFLAYPLTGVGAGNYPVRYNDFGGWERRWRVSHNMFVDAAAELGIGGISLLMALILITLKDAWKIQKAYTVKKQKKSLIYYMNLAAFASIVTYCTGGMFQSVLYYPMFYFLIGIAVATKRVAETTELA